MINDTKLVLFENLNVLQKFAKQGSKSFPDDLCLFLSDELNLKSVYLFEENSENNFVQIGKTTTFDEQIIPNFVSVKEYSNFKNELNFTGNIFKECLITVNVQNENLQSIIFNLNENKFGILILVHKIQPALEDRKKFFNVAQFVQNCFSTWKNSENMKSNILNSNDDLIPKTIKGFQKELKTINGLLTLAKEENSTNSINKYLDQIKNSHQFISSSLEDLNNILNLLNSNADQLKSKFNISNFLEDLIKSKNAELPDSRFILNNVDQKEIHFDEKVLKSILNSALNFSLDLSQTNEVILNSDFISDNKIYFKIIGKNAKLEKSELIQLQTPFGKREVLKKTSGLSLNLLAQTIDFVDGSLKLNIEENNFIINITLPFQAEIQKSIHEILMENNKSNKDKILVIESDQASSALLNNYLSKWNYQTEIVNSGDFAIKLLQQNKYVAVILNIEQGNENSLEILQKIKNNKFTRNTPVIVFSMEAEKEKVYLMGAVEYLVKPINYNNLVEILTSYKLRRNSTVLCVDDDQPTLKLVQQAVQTAGFNVIAEYRPELVLDLIIDKDLDLAIVDLDMPKLNGFDLIKQIKSHGKFDKLPIIIYTGKEDYQQDLQKIDGMFVDLLDKKSTSLNELENAISAMINNIEETKSIEEVKEKSDSPTILMAEDYKHSQIIVTRLLKKSGFENVIVVENGEEALNICKKEKIDLILMDMQMPVMNGFEATQKIREIEEYVDTPIIALTAFAMKGDREKCLEAGATDYIPKPIDSKEFIEKVKYYTQIKIEN
ncbi:MAG: response regulator [Ignavibacteriae bacterium]|nr:response regulator [Ignavibacteriota bacterium]